MIRTGTRTRTGLVTFLVRLAATCGAGVCLLTGCSADTADPAPPMTLTVSTVTGAPMTVWFDVRQRSRSGVKGRGLDPTPVELGPQRPTVVLTVPHERDSWVWARVAGPFDRPSGTVLGCELRTADGRVVAVVAVDASDPLGPPTDEAACGGAG